MVQSLLLFLMQSVHEVHVFNICIKYYYYNLMRVKEED